MFISKEQNGKKSFFDVDDPGTNREFFTDNLAPCSLVVIFTLSILFLYSVNKWPYNITKFSPHSIIEFLLNPLPLLYIDISFNDICFKSSSNPQNLNLGCLLVSKSLLSYQY